MPHMKLSTPAPPLQNDEQDEKWNAKFGHCDHGRVRQDVAAGQSIDPLCDATIHRSLRCWSFDPGFDARMNERRIHQIFQVSVLLKGAHALIECAGGIALAIVSTSTIANLVNALTQEELIEDPSDF